MIVRDDGSHVLLVTQPDHAALAARLMEHWRADGFAGRPTRPVVLHATAHHDDGWCDEDAAPVVDPSTGRPYDFIGMAAERRQRIWPRAIAALAESSTYVAALVAQHALTIYRRYRRDPEWTGFFETIESERDRWFADDRRPDGTSGGALDVPVTARTTFLQDYAMVRMGDLLSLAFCNAWTTREELEGYGIWMDDPETLVVAPDPFGGRTVPFEVVARRIPARRYASDAELRDAIAGAPAERLAGRIVGVDGPAAS